VVEAGCAVSTRVGAALIDIGLTERTSESR
jgi:hypothetical protein